ncbi:MAG: hypothetical protein ACTJHC_08000 [Vagococcus sp.]
MMRFFNKKQVDDEFNEDTSRISATEFKQHKEKYDKQQEMLAHIRNIRTRVDAYDWDYRLSRFNDKVDTHQRLLNQTLTDIRETRD